MKRTMDVTLAGLALLFLSPVLVLISLMIMIRDPGPVFFGHERIGYGGRSSAA